MFVEVEKVKIKNRAIQVFPSYKIFKLGKFKFFNLKKNLTKKSYKNPRIFFIIQ